jgi:hypothetical protein
VQSALYRHRNDELTDCCGGVHVEKIFGARQAACLICIALDLRFFAAEEAWPTLVRGVGVEPMLGSPMIQAHAIRHEAKLSEPEYALASGSDGRRLRLIAPSIRACFPCDFHGASVSETTGYAAPYARSML